MIIGEKGRITENIYMLGHAAMPLYLIDADRPTIVDTGLAFMADLYAEEIRSVLGGRCPDLCLLTHAHFDHCGATAGLKNHFPGMRVAASVHTRSILSNPGAVEKIEHLNRAAEPLAGQLGLPVPAGCTFAPFAVERTLAEGDRLFLSDQLSVQVIETPGHTRDMLNYYLPESRVLFASEAAGIPDQTGYITIDCLLDYDQYVTSLNKLQHLALDMICLGHRCALIGADARRYLARAMESCTAFFHTTRRYLDEETGDLKKVAARIRAFEYDPKPQPKQPEPAYLLNLEARIRAIAKKCGQTVS